MIPRARSTSTGPLFDGPPFQHYYYFPYDGKTGAEVRGNQIVHFVDGQRGDHDLTVNGQIETLGAPVLGASRVFYVPLYRQLMPPTA